MNVQVDYIKPPICQEICLSTWVDLMHSPLVVGGDSVFKVYEDLTDEDFVYGFQRKFLAQINLVRIGTPYARDERIIHLIEWFSQ